ncbi:hypothetical protein VPH35_040826 [Triticum aestivum]
MVRPALATAGRTLPRRFCGQPTAAGSLSRPVRDCMLRDLHSQQAKKVGDAAAATAGHRFGLFRRYLEPKPHAMAIAQLSTAGAGVSQSQIDWVEACVVSSDEWVAEVDWVEAGVVSPVVRYQRHCAVGQWLLQPQAMHYLNTSQSILLSVQELIDCETESDRCEGGNEQDAFTYIQRNGLSSESDYPYKAERSISEKAVAKQPVVVTLQCSDDMLRYYKGGSLDYKAVSDNTDKDKHAVLIVGYGIDSNGVKYWRFKSSWGADWGEGAFGRIRRHVDDERGALGIFLEEGVYPVLED